MAKARSSRKSATPRRIGSLVSLFVVIGIGAAAYVYGAPLASNAQTATAYSARIVCSCRFVAGRDLDDCGKDKIPGMELVSLSEDVAARSVTASIPFVASDTASLRDGYGCVLQPWQRDG